MWKLCGTESLLVTVTSTVNGSFIIRGEESVTSVPSECLAFTTTFGFINASEATLLGSAGDKVSRVGDYQQVRGTSRRRAQLGWRRV